MYVEMQRPGFVFFFSILYLYILYCKFSSVGASFYFTFEYLFYMLTYVPLENTLFLLVFFRVFELYLSCCDVLT